MTGQPGRSSGYRAGAGRRPCSASAGTMKKATFKKQILPPSNASVNFFKAFTATARGAAQAATNAAIVTAAASDVLVQSLCLVSSHQLHLAAMANGVRTVASASTTGGEGERSTGAGCGDGSTGCSDESNVWALLTHSDQHVQEFMQATKQITHEECGLRFRMKDFIVDNGLEHANGLHLTVSGRIQARSIQSSLAHLTLDCVLGLTLTCTLALALTLP
eukprot:CAMPEP_0174724648 /NCGR_PEP_ID=MMETSP1094-20130205/43786_1 /TAXON_ID=156173 /ORGANISM="Chrysochromulina brevifilum, Strain UTEX LB 985" /LENGTH=218 /DNA_ID=CAMNT_0015925893 /DNA_START=87 /DNA_END=741 /DNA_ORIENTATION=-